MYLKIKEVGPKTKSFRQETSQKWQKVFKFVEVGVLITLVHENSRKIQVFRKFSKSFIFVFLVCQRVLSTYVDSQKITDIVVFLSLLSFHRCSWASQYTEKRNRIIFFTCNLHYARVKGCNVQWVVRVHMAHIYQLVGLTLNLTNLQLYDLFLRYVKIEFILK